MIELTAKQAADAIKAGDLDAGEYFDFYRQRAATDEFNSYIWVAEDTPSHNGGPLAGVPLGLPVFHVLEPEMKAQFDPAVYDEQVSIMEGVLETDALIRVVKQVREGQID